jgi:hypothetical protein
VRLGGLTERSYEERHFPRIHGDAVDVDAFCGTSAVAIAAAARRGNRAA